MAPSIIWHRLRKTQKRLRVLDPMAGSGTTVVASRLAGHEAVGFDTDPLALLITRTWSSNVDAERLRKAAERVLTNAIERYRSIPVRNAYPIKADEETRAFVRFWFDPTNRRQLAALSAEISEISNTADQTFMWCAFSRLIITKHAGASLAMDVSHSRPHKAFSVAPIKAFDRFLSAVEMVLKGSPFQIQQKFPNAIIKRVDARKLPSADETFDLVITSPPYLNAIDYLRGHKFSLIWMGHKLAEIRDLRGGNVGTESTASPIMNYEKYLEMVLDRMGAGSLSGRIRAMLIRYLKDMDQVLSEIARVLKREGEAVIVVGDSTLAGIFIRNSRALTLLGKRNGLHLRSMRKRPLAENRRYLPPPGRKSSGLLLRSRMREEVVLVFSK